MMRTTICTNGDASAPSGSVASAPAAPASRRLPFRRGDGDDPKQHRQVPIPERSQRGLRTLELRQREQRGLRTLVIAAEVQPPQARTEGETDGDDGEQARVNGQVRGTEADRDD
jgi:hypothetical protein